MLPPDFYDNQQVQAALGRYDFATVFRAIRAATGVTQRQLGELVGLEQGQVSKIECGARPLLDVRMVAQVATKCGIPPIKLGFGTATVGNGGVTGRKGSWMDRRDFVAHVAAVALGGMAGAGLDIERLTSLLPADEPVSSRRVGAADVDAIEQTTVAFMRQDFAVGSGPSRDAAVAQLRSLLPLLSATVSDDLRPRLQVAIAELAMMAGYMSFEVRQHEAARRLWTVGLDVARGANSELGTDLAVYLLYDMTLQSVHIGNPDEALRLAQLGHAAAVGHRISPATASCLVAAQARAHAARGDAAACERALGEAVDHCDAARSSASPRWVAHVGETGLVAYQGVAQYTLALSKGDHRAAGRAVDLLGDGIQRCGPAYARLRALYLPDLAGAHGLAGDVDTAVEVGHQAVDAISGVASPRAHDRLTLLRTALEPMRDKPGVADLRERLATAA